MKKIYLLLILLISLGTFSCASDSFSDLVEIDEGPNETPVNFVDDIQPIMNNNCLPCHGNPPINGAPISLTTFEEVMASTENNLIDRISLQPGQGGFMPLGGARLPQNLIDLIIQWRDEGFLEEAP